MQPSNIMSGRRRWGNQGTKWWLDFRNNQTPVPRLITCHLSANFSFITTGHLQNNFIVVTFCSCFFRAHVYVQVLVCAWAWVGQRLMSSSASLNFFLPYCWRQGLSLNSKLADSAQTGWLVRPKILLSLPPQSWDYRCFVQACLRSELRSLCLCGKHFLTDLSPQTHGRYFCHSIYTSIFYRIYLNNRSLVCFH